jgi:CspA family cold shock protein
MGRGHDWRPPRRRGFDDDDFSAPIQASRFGGPSPSFTRSAPPVPSGPAVRAIVKWFNAEKGFGFVEVPDGSGDAFLHVAVLRPARRENVSPGTTLQVRIAPGQKGPQVTEVVEIDESSAAAESARPASRSPRGEAASVNPGVVRGTVKWFNQEKGYGFIAPDEGGPDVFVHVTAVERSGLPTLREGQILEYQTQLQGNGKNAAVNLRLT